MANITKASLKQLIDQNLADYSNITPDRHRDVLYAILECISYQGDIRHVRMNNTDIPIYFDTSGLGRVNEQYEGWAICNGNNGTQNDGGRTYIGYDPNDYPILGQQAGETSHTLTEQELPNITIRESVQNTVGDQTVPAGSTPYFVAQNKQLGSGQAHNNMQPYTVVLKIQKV